MNMITDINEFITLLRKADMEQVLDYGHKAIAHTVRVYQAMELGAFIHKNGLNDVDGANMEFIRLALMAGKLDDFIYYGEE